MMKLLPLKKLLFILVSVFVIPSAYAQVVINEVFVSPSTGTSATTNANSLYNTDPGDQPPKNREWIELFNPSPCDTVDLSCFTLGSNMEPPLGSGYSNWGAFTFPAGTKILPLNFIIVGGNDAQVPYLDFDLNYYRQNTFGVQYLCGESSRWFLRDEYGWIGLYSPTGAVIDAVYWDLYGVPANLNLQSEYANPVNTTTSCNGSMSLPAAASIPGIEYAGMIITSTDYSLQRTSDGASSWFATAMTPTARSCNSNCVGPPTVDCSVVNESCAGGDGSITVSITNGSTPPYTIQWLHPVVSNQPTINNLSAGTYVVQVTDASGCFIVYDTAEVVRLPGPDITNSQVVNESCTASNGSINLTITALNNPVSYHWSSSTVNSGHLINLAAGLYNVTVTDHLGCTDTASFTLFNQPGPEIQISGVVNEMCTSANATISTVTTSGTAPFHYSWNGNSSLNVDTLNNIHAGDYTVVVTDANGCTATADTSLTDTPPPTVSFSNITDETCHKGNGSATLHLEGGTPPYTFEWVEFPDNTDTILNNLGEGNYSVDVSDVNCQLTTSFHINNIPGPVAAFRIYPEATSIELPRVVFYDESVGATKWDWDFGDWRYSTFPSPIHDYRDTGVFKVTLMIRDDQGCMDSVSHNILIISPITLFIPNAFTPNSDGLNDKYMIYGMHITDFEIYIYNRWGGEVYHSTDMNTGWDGTFNNQPSPEGLYSWVLWYKEDYELFQMDRKVLTGSMTLFR